MTEHEVYILRALLIQYWEHRAAPVLPDFTHAQFAPLATTRVWQAVFRYGFNATAPPSLQDVLRHYTSLGDEQHHQQRALPKEQAR